MDVFSRAVNSPKRHRYLGYLAIHFAALDPRSWLRIARAVDASSGAAPPIGVLLMTALLAGGSIWFRSSLVLMIGFFIWGMGWMVVSLLASCLALADSLRHLARFRFRAFQSSAFWFEVARTACLVGAMATSLAVATSSLDALVPRVGEYSFVAAAASVLAFFLASTAAYLLMQFGSQVVNGKARECADFFYPHCLGGVVIGGLLLSLGPRLNQPEVYGPVLGSLVVVCLTVAMLLSRRPVTRSGS